MLEATVYSNPTVDYVYIDEKSYKKPGGPGYYYAFYSRLLDTKVHIIGQSAPSDYHFLKQAHNHVEAELELQITNCTQKFLLLYSSGLPQKRIVYPLTRCTLVFKTRKNNVNFWSPTILASRNDILILRYLLKQNTPISIDFQGLARSPEFIHVYLNTVKNHFIQYAHMDLEEYRKICSIIGEATIDKCLKLLRVKEAIISNGSEPGFSYCDGKIYQAIPPFKVSGEESTGAGDVLLFAFTISRVKGKNCEEAIKLSLEIATTHVHLINILGINDLLKKIKRFVSLKPLL